VINIIDGSNMLHRAMYNPEGKFGVHPLRELYLRFMLADPHTIIVWDGMHSLKRRRDLFPGYKQRPDKGEDIKAAFDLLKEVLCHTPIMQIEVPYWEADDVLATVAKDYLAQGFTVKLESNDQDFWQLAHYANLELPLVKPLPCEPYQTCLFKALCGDQSDKIPGWRGFGPAKWAAVQKDCLVLQGILNDEDYSVWEAYKWPKGVTPTTETFYNCCIFYKIVQLLQVPEEDFTDNYIIGKSNPAQAEQIMDRWRI